VLKPNRHKAVLNLLMRPGSVEVFSPSAELYHHLKMPGGWPEQALLCTDDPDGVPPPECITPHLGLFGDPFMKELVVTGRGVRVVRMIAQASRLHYTVFREVRFEGDVHLDPAIAATLLDTAIRIAEAVHDAPPVEQAA
jgi:hypothetical protein